MHLYMLPYAGSSATVYTKWKQYFEGSGVICVLIEINGRGRLTDKPFFKDIETAAQSIIYNHIKDEAGGMALFGHSMGGVLAFEIARILSQGKRPPTHLFISGTNTPDFKGSDWDVESLSDQQFLKSLTKIGGFQETFFENPAYQTYFLPILRADYAMLNTYSPYHPQPLPCKITVFTGSEDPYSMDDIEHWREFSQHGLVVHRMRGNHFFLHQHAEAMSRIMITQLSTAM